MLNSRDYRRMRRQLIRKVKWGDRWLLFRLYDVDSIVAELCLHYKDIDELSPTAINITLAKHRIQRDPLADQIRFTMLFAVLMIVCAMAYRIFTGE